MNTLFAGALLTLLVTLVVSFLRWRQKTFSYFKDIGIPGPKPNLLWGNLWEYHENGLFRALNKWCKKYGDIFGFYNGDVPFLVVRDPDFLKHVFITNFSNFTDRGITLRSDEMHPLAGRGLMHAKGADWKSMRSCVTSGLTAAKIKPLMDHITQVCDVFMDVLDNKAKLGKEVCMLEALQALTMDYAARPVLGIDSSFQHDLSNPYFNSAQLGLKESMTGPFHMLAQCTTTLGALAAPLLWLNAKLGTSSIGRLGEKTATVVEFRRKNPEMRRKDILQNLIDAEYEEPPASETSSDKSVRKTRPLTSDEVVMTAAIVFIGGFETTAITLCCLAFALGKHPDVQEKVRQELKRVIDDCGPLNYETVTQKLKYVDQVVSETLRMWPPGLTFTTRRAKEDFEYQGTKYKAGTCIMSPTLQMHMDERFFPDPTKFDPDRFSDENVGSFPNVAYQPFGIGPRNCLGSKLGLVELVYTVAQMTQHFCWELGESQRGELAIEQYAMVLTPANGPWIIFHKI